MKRFFHLLLFLICFLFSYADDLSPEKQQQAWNFIYKNLLHENRPVIFQKDIIINLKGKVTSEDSIVVNDIIKGFQRVIPHLKITLSDKPGNLVLGLNYNKKNTINSNLNNQEISSQEMYFPVPDDLTNYQRKQFIYYYLLKGLTFTNNPQTVVPELSGCVFAEKDFRLVSFSAYDHFIIEKLYSPDLPSLLIKNLDSEVQKTAWNSIFLKFMGNTKKPIIYRNDIVIKLNGTITPVDSSCMNEIINVLRTAIPNRKIYFANENANLIISFYDESHGIITYTKPIGYSIQNTKLDFGFSPELSREARKKTLYYNLLRSLVHSSPSKHGSVGIPGCVFDEENSQNLTYSPFDAFMLNKLYAKDFQEQFKNYFVGHYSYRNYLIQLYHNELNLGFFLLGLILATIFLSVLIIKNVFKTHQWNWFAYIKQGLFLISIGVVFTICQCLKDLNLDTNDVFTLLNLFVSGLVAVNLIYVIEKTILKKRHLGGSKIIIHFSATLVVLVIVAFPLSFRFSAQDIIFNIPLRYNLLLSYILAISLGRSLYIFLNDRYRSILKQKDVELAQMGELQKQAELDSLRAKINPHFLYNALNSIASLATTDARKTEQMALALSDFFKYAINREQKQLNSLSEELSATRTYLEIEKVRFGDRLNFEIECNPELLEHQIPQLLIQPLVENAIKHGLSQIIDKGMIRIVIIRENSQLNIRVYDNGPSFPDGPLSGFGIQNTQQRITLLYGSKATINWNNQPEKFIELSLPFDN